MLQQVHWYPLYTTRYKHRNHNMGYIATTPGSGEDTFTTL